MEVFRISKKDFANLEGLGGLYYPGRWHEVGHRVIYSSQHRSLAALEYLVHLSSASLLQTNFVISTIYIPDKVHFESITASKLPDSWTNIQSVSITRKLGTAFLRTQTGLFLKVPSALVEGEYNFIVNPNHPSMKDCRIIDTKPFSFDGRLVK